MATVYSDEVSIGSYNKIRIKCDYSGTSATVEIQFRRTSSYTTTWADPNATFTLNGTTKAADYSYTGTVGTSWVTLRSGISGFSISSTESKTYSWTFYNSSGAVLGCSGSIYIPAQYTYPSGLSANVAAKTTNTISLNVYCTDYGTGVGPNGLTASVLGASATTHATGRRVNNNVTSLPSVVTNSSTAYDGGITISPNTQYSYGVWATNGSLSEEKVYTGGVVTLPPALSAKSVGTITTSSIQINYTTAADGGKYTKNIQYSLNNSTWTTGATVSSASATSGSFTISGLSAYTSYTIYLRVNTTAGTTTSGSLSAKTNAVPPANPTISNLSYTNNSITFTLNESSWGTPSSGRWEYYWGTSSGTTSNYVLNPTSGYTSNSSCSNTISSLTSNTRYYIRYRVYNQAVNNPSGLIETSTVIKPSLPTYVSGSLTYTDNSCSFRVSVAADGGVYTKTVRYSIDNGANYVNSNLTFSGGSAQTGTVTITGLSPHTTYAIRIDCTTTAGAAPSYNSVETFTTALPYYGSVSGVTKRVKKLYGSVNGVTKEINHLYGSVNGVTKKIF